MTPIIIIEIRHDNPNKNLKTTFCVQLAHSIGSLSEAFDFCRARHQIIDIRDCELDVRPRLNPTSATDIVEFS